MIVAPISVLKVEVLPCTILRKVNRFVIEARVGKEVVRVHNTNTGKLEDLIWEGNKAYCSVKESGKTRYRLEAAEVRGGGFAVVNTNLQEEAFHRAVEIGIIEKFKGCRVVRRRPRVGKGFSDFMLECSKRNVIVEIKSADLKGPFEEAMWPDCPTERGRRHLAELSELTRRGIESYVVFVAGFPNACCFKPYVKGDPLILDALMRAQRSGVKMMSVGMYFDPFDNSVKLYSDNLPVVLNE